MKSRFSALVIALAVTFLLGGCVEIGYSVSGGGYGPGGVGMAKIAAYADSVLPAYCANGTGREQRRLDYEEQGSTWFGILLNQSHTQYDAEVSCD